MSEAPLSLARARAYEQEQSALIASNDRPLFHLTPWVGWMNDPNGICYYKGSYHLFYQYHPYSTAWGPMHWGHAVSHDLLRWTHLPCALAPDTAADAGGCFSGSAVPLPDGRLMLCYTGVQATGVQAQCAAFGDGTDFEKHRFNPIIDPGQLPEGYSAQDFRDPKVWHSKSGPYYMVAANRQAERQGSILLFSSKDGLAWRFMGEIDSSRKEYGRMWECPDFFTLEDRHVLLVSPQEMRAREEFHPGHGTVAILGRFDKQNYRLVRQSVQPADHGLNFYAPQTVLSPDGRRIMIGWMDNWGTCKNAPRPHPWYGQMSAPRELFIKGGRLMQRPVREMEKLWLDTIIHDRIAVQGQTALPGIQGRLLDMTVTLYPEGARCRCFTLQIAQNSSYSTRILCDFARNELTFDRSGSGSLRDIAHTRQVPAAARAGKLVLRLLMDKESVELFINDGERVLTALLPTPLTADGITFAADAPLCLSVQAHHLGEL